MKTIYYCGIPIEYSLIRKQVKNINIRISENGEILVSARNGISVSDINTFVKNKAEWIIRSLAAVERYNLTKPDSEIYIGKRVFYLGEMYIIDIIGSKDDKVELDGEIITIYSKNIYNSDYLKGIYLSWLKEQASLVFEETLKKMFGLVKSEKIPYPKFTIRNMKSRWGSCSVSQKSITLNLQLIKADRQSIEQVVLHELIHFKEAGHNEKFYSLLDKYMSDWYERKERLEEKFKDGL